MSSLETLADLLFETRLPLLDDFALDHAEALSALGGLSVDDLDVTQVSAARIAAQVGGYTFEMSGGQLRPVGSAEALVEAIDTAFADASLTQLRLSDAVLDVVRFNLTDDGFVLSSGDQAVQVTGRWPSSLEEISKLANLLTEAQSYGDLEDTGRRSLVAALKALDISEVVLRDGGADLLRYQHDEGTTSLSSASTTVSVTEGRTDTAKTFHLHISGVDPAPEFGITRAGADLEDIPYSLPEIIDEIGLDYAPEEIERVVLLGDHTYITTSLEQSLAGPYAFDLRVVVDSYFAQDIPAFVEGTDLADVLTGSAADELFRGRSGDDRIDGAGGEDAARFTGLSGQHSVLIGQNQLEVTDRTQDGEGRDILTNIETLKFDDQFIHFGDLKWVPQVTREDVVDLTQIYIAYLDRVPDVEGLLFWLEATITKGLDLTDIAKQFSTQPEFALEYPSDLSVGAFVEMAYGNILGRAADADGHTFWVDTLNAGDADRSTFILDFLEGVTASANTGADAGYLNDLTEIGIYFALENGLNETGTAAAILDLYAEGGRDVAGTLQTIDLLRSEAETSDDTFLLSLPGFWG